MRSRLPRWIASSVPRRERRRERRKLPSLTTAPTPPSTESGSAAPLVAVLLRRKDKSSSCCPFRSGSVFLRRVSKDRGTVDEGMTSRLVQGASSRPPEYPLSCERIVAESTSLLPAPSVMADNCLRRSDEVLRMRDASDVERKLLPSSSVEKPLRTAEQAKWFRKSKRTASCER